MSQKNQSIIRLQFRRIAGIDDLNSRQSAANSKRALGGVAIAKATSSIWDEYQRLECTDKYAIGENDADIADISDIFDTNIKKIGGIRGKSATDKLNRIFFEEPQDFYQDKSTLDFESVAGITDTVIFLSNSVDYDTVKSKIDLEQRFQNNKNPNNIFDTSRNPNLSMTYVAAILTGSPYQGTLQELATTASSQLNTVPPASVESNQGCVFSSSDIDYLANKYSKETLKSRNYGLTPDDSLSNKLANIYGNLIGDELSDRKGYYSSKQLKSIKNNIQALNEYLYFYNLGYTQKWSSFVAWGSNKFTVWVNGEKGRGVGNWIDNREDTRLLLYTTIGTYAAMNVTPTGNTQRPYATLICTSDDVGYIGEWCFGTCPSIIAGQAEVKGANNNDSGNLAHLFFSVNQCKFFGNSLYKLKLNDFNNLVFDNIVSLDTNFHETTTILSLKDANDNNFQILIDEQNCCFRVLGLGQMAEFDFFGNRLSVNVK